MSSVRNQIGNILNGLHRDNIRVFWVFHQKLENTFIAKNGVESMKMELVENRTLSNAKLFSTVVKSSDSKFVVIKGIHLCINLRPLPMPR